MSVPPVAVEICVDSIDGAVAAEQGGAQRVELCSALLEGGLTPSAGTMAVARQAVGVGIHMMVRPRGGDFLYSAREIDGMRRDIDAAKSLGADGVLRAETPPIRTDDPSVPSDFGEYMAQTSFWTLENEQTIVRREMQKATPLARHLTAYFLRNDVGLSQHFKEELEAYLRGIAGALGVNVTKVEVVIPDQEVVIPVRPEITLCEGTVAIANGTRLATLDRALAKAATSVGVNCILLK